MTVSNGSFCDWYEAQVLADFINNKAKAIGLVTVLPADTGSGASPANGTEVANANGYGRVALVAANWQVTVQVGLTTQQAVYTVSITFPNPSGSWGNAVGWVIFDNATYGSGNQVAYGKFLPALSIGANGQLTLPPNAVIVAVD